MLSSPIYQSVGPQHFAVPFRLGPSGSHNTVEQDSAPDVSQCVQALLRTRRGRRIEVPGFGIPDPAFMTTADNWSQILERAVRQWEPRAAGAGIPVVIHPDGTATVTVPVAPPPSGPAVNPTAG